MGASNHRPRISLQFNDFDFRHRKVLEILRARPRNMTDLVVNAILHFISCPDAEQEYDKEALKKIIRGYCGDAVGWYPRCQLADCRT